MTVNRRFGTKCTSLFVSIVVMAAYASAQSKSNKYACSEAKPAQLCTAANTCGSASSPCSIDVKRTSNAASSTPDIPNAKSNSLFCVKVGTTVQWKSTGKNIGFVVDMSSTSPFVTSTPQALACRALSMGCADKRMPSWS
jgi:hypothetical protein